MPKLTGVCRMCGCTERTPCVFRVGFTLDEEQDADEMLPCAWLDEEHTLCTNPRCVANVPLDDLLDICFPRPPKVRAVAV